MRLAIPSLLKHRWFQFIIVLLLILGGYFYWQNSHRQGEAIKTYQVIRQDLKQYVTASGEITAAQQASVRFQTIGRLAWVGVKKGDYVSQWQAIASLDQQDLQKRFKQALLDYQAKRVDFEASLKQNESQIISRNYLDIQTLNNEQLTLYQILQKNQLSLDKAVIDVELANLAKQYGTIYSPIEGIITKATNEYAGVDTSATTEYVVVNPNTLRFSAQIEETDIGKIKVGDTATVILDAFQDENITNTISDIDFTPTTTSSGNNAYIANIPLQPDRRFRLEMNGNVEVLVNEKNNVLAVPIEAVEEQASKRLITVLRNNNQKEKIEVTTGLETDEYYEVISGLNEGDTIVLP